MIHFTFQTEADYNKFVETVLLFTSLQAYNACAHLWKKEDRETINIVGNISRRGGGYINEEEKAAGKRYKEIHEEYGHKVSTYSEWFRSCDPNNVLQSFGFTLDDDDFDTLDSVAGINKGEEFPSSFPVITCISGSGRDLYVNHLYPKDFDTNWSEGFDWLRENARNFWEKGEGNMY